MTREFVYVPMFIKNWNNLKLTDEHLRLLEQELLKNPSIGDVIEGTGGLRKMRYALPHQGKSGSTRILYVDFIAHEQLYLINIYPKNEKENITDAEKADYKKLIKILNDSLRRG